MIAENDIRLMGLLNTLDFKVYPNVAPENIDIPFGTYQNILSNRPYGLRDSIDKVKSKYYVKVYTKSYSELIEKVALIEGLLLDDKVSLLEVSISREEDLHTARLSVVIYQ